MNRFEPFEFKGYKGTFNKQQNVACIEFPSSKEGDFYDVTIFGEDNTIHCECKSWQFRSSCRHVLAIRSLLGA